MEKPLENAPRDESIKKINNIAHLWLQGWYNHRRKGVFVKVVSEQYDHHMEDLHDLTIVAERREETPISLEEMKRRLKEDGVI